MARRVVFLLITLFIGSAAAAHPGWGIVADGAGNIFYTDLTQVWKIGPDGKQAVVVPGVHTHELYLDADGTLHGEHLWYEGKTETWGYYDWRLERDGTFVRRPPKEGFRTDESFVRDAAGAMYWLDKGRIRKRPREGPVVDVAVVPTRPEKQGEGRDGLLTVSPAGVVFAIADGDLYRIGPGSKVTPVASDLDEHVWTSFTTPRWHYIMSLTADAEGNVYVANLGARQLKKVTPEGRVEVVLSARVPWAPSGAVVTPRGVYVLEVTDTGGSVRVRRVGKDGKVSIVGSD